MQCSSLLYAKLSDLVLISITWQLFYSYIFIILERIQPIFVKFKKNIKKWIFRFFLKMKNLLTHFRWKLNFGAIQISLEDEKIGTFNHCPYRVKKWPFVFLKKFSFSFRNEKKTKNAQFYLVYFTYFVVRSQG